jgi:hypothetical protein
MYGYRIIGIIFSLAGAAYTARALLLIRVPGELPMTNTYLLVIGILLCLSALAVFPSRGGVAALADGVVYHFLTLLCFIVFALTFEKVGAIKGSFIFSFVLGTLWNRNIPASKETAQKFSFIAFFLANRKNIAENILASCVCTAGIWLVFERVFSLSLP